MTSFKIKSDYTEYIKIFLEENSKLNLVSQNDEKLLFEKHIYDSLALKLFIEKYNIKKANIVDIGCGGGFPCVPLAIEFPEFEITGIDSIRKKINAVNNIKNSLKLDNLNLICDRAENIKKKYDIVVSRAVGDLFKILEYGMPLMSKNGFFVAYKSKKSDREILESENVLKKYGAKVIDIIEYKLPLNEVYERKLVIVKNG